jgi:hypothetical protein
VLGGVSDVLQLFLYNENKTRRPSFLLVYDNLKAVVVRKCGATLSNSEITLITIYNVSYVIKNLLSSIPLPAKIRLLETIKIALVDVLNGSGRGDFSNLWHGQN